MAEVKWIKLNIGMFDGNSFKRIKKAEIGGVKYRDKLTAVWFELLEFAGKCNANGQLVESSEIPFTSLEDIAILIDREPEELKLCMQFYINARMVTVIDDIYMLTNWAKYQDADKLEALREYNREAQRKSREKKKALQAVNDKSMTDAEEIIDCHATEEEREKEGEEDKEYHSFIHSAENDEEFLDEDERREALLSQQRTALNGPLGGGVVFLSDKQMDDLLNKLSLDEFHHYIGIVRDCELKGKSYKKKTHYQAILDMAIKDRKVK